MKLVSDFKEWYDVVFDDQVPTWTRYSNSGPDKKRQFDLMETAGLRVIPHGPMRELIKVFPKDNYIVYYNEYQHAGEGKSMAENHYKHFHEKDNHLGSLYIDTSGWLFAGDATYEYKSRSKRLLVIGRKSFIIHYESYQDWRSNCGEGNSSVKELGPDIYNPLLSLLTPIYAVDYVHDKQGDVNYCIDYNVAPGTSGLNLFNHITASAVKDEVEWWFKVRMGEPIDSLLQEEILKLTERFRAYINELGIC